VGGGVPSVVKRGGRDTQNSRWWVVVRSWQFDAPVAVRWRKKREDSNMDIKVRRNGGAPFEGDPGLLD